MKGAKMKIKSVTVLGAFAAMIAGCAQDGARPATSTLSVAPAIAAAEGKAFYLFRAGYKCGGPMGGGELVASWVDKVEVVEGKLLRWGSRCGGEGLPVPDEERRTAKLNADATTLTLGGATYRLSADPVKEAGTTP